MKPFDLEAALRGEPVMTRKGRRVVRIAHFPDASRMSRVAAHIEEVGVYLFSEDGRMYADFPGELDLFMAPRKKVAWINLCPDMYATAYTSQEEADACAGSDRVGGKAIRIEWEE